MKKYLAFLVFTFLANSNSIAQEYELAILNVGLFDGSEDQGVVNLGIASGAIAAITTQAISGEVVVDGSGKYIIPGLVNAHAHVSNLDQLRAGYLLGILTLLNMHTGLEERELQWKQQSQDSTEYSTLFGAGHAATIEGGHPSQFSPGMETIGKSLSVQEWVDHRISNKVDFIKVIRESHEWMGNSPQPTLSFNQIQQIIEYSHSQGYKVVVHSNTIDEMEKVAAMNPDGFVHMLDYKEDYPVPNSYYTALRESGAFVVPSAGIALKSTADAPLFVQQWVEENLLTAEQRATVIRAMHDSGIPIVAGTDAQDGQMDFAADYFLELSLYKRAGLSNIEILRTATGNAAKAFGLPIGEIKLGGPATMVLLNGSPLSDLENLRKVEQVWKKGRSAALNENTN